VAAIAHQLVDGWELARDRGASLRGVAALVAVAAVAGEQVAPRASRPSRVVQDDTLKGWCRGTPRAGYRGCALRSLWSLRPIILVDYRQPRALARGDAPLREAARGGVLARSRGLHAGHELSGSRARARAF